MSYSGIQDLNGNPLTNLVFGLRFLESKEFDIQVACRSGVSLRSINGANVFYYARFSGGDPWTDLEADGLDLSPFTGTLKVIHVKVETDENTSAKEQNTRLYLQ